MRSLIITTLLLSGCPKTPTPTTTAESSEFASSAWVLTDSGLRYEDLVLGTGATITPNSRAEVHYVGKLGDGTTFDSSYDRGKPFGLTVGTGMVIKGWDEGLLGMREGGKRKLLIPPHLGYGSSGTGPIPPNSTLEFEVEVLSVKAPRVPSAAPAAVDVGAFRTTESGLMIAAIDGSCEGEPHPAGTILTFEVDGFLDTGKLVVTSRLSDEPTMVAAGLGQAEPGLDEGLVNTPLGCKNQVRVPSELAYRDMERPPEAVAGVGLVYDIEVLEVAPPRVAPEAPREAGNHLQSGTGLAVAILEPGEGEGAKTGDVVVVEYTGWLEDGTRFDSSFLRPKPISFVLGQGRVIAGWEEGLMGMRVGEQRQLIIPPDLAYGARGRPPTIPASATLIFEVELTGIE